MPIEAILACQAGLITRAQAVAAGVPARVVDERVRRRCWAPVLPRVYRARPDLADEAELRVRAAMLWAGADVVLTGLAAAWWHGFVGQLPQVVTVAVPRRRRPLHRPGLTLLSRTCDPADLTDHRGLLVTAGPLTLLDAAVELGSAGAALLDSGLRSGVLITDLLAAQRRTSGAPGATSAALHLRDLQHKWSADLRPIGPGRMISGGGSFPVSA